MPTPIDIGYLLAAGISGIWLGKTLRLPSPLLFGPALVSAVLHFSGLTHAAVPPVIIAFAQVVIGISVGVRFAGAKLVTVGITLLMAVIQALVLLVLAILAAWAGHLLNGLFRRRGAARLHARRCPRAKPGRTELGYRPRLRYHSPPTPHYVTDVAASSAPQADGVQHLAMTRICSGLQ